MGNNPKSVQKEEEWLGCCAQDEKSGQQFDLQNYETLQRTEPMGQISKESIEYLSGEEKDFFKCCGGRNVAMLRHFLQKGVNVNSLDQERTSPLHVAVRSGSLMVVEELVNNGSDVNLQDLHGWTPLHIAVALKKPLLVHLLVAKGAYTQQMTRTGRLPSQMTSHKGTLQVLNRGESKQTQVVVNDLIANEETAQSVQKLTNRINLPDQQKEQQVGEHYIHSRYFFVPRKHKFYLYFKKMIENKGSACSDYNHSSNPRGLNKRAHYTPSIQQNYQDKVDLDDLTFNQSSDIESQNYELLTNQVQNYQSQKEVMQNENVNISPNRSISYIKVTNNIPTDLRQSIVNNNQRLIPTPSQQINGSQAFKQLGIKEFMSDYTSGQHKSIMYIENEAISIQEMIIFKDDQTFPLQSTLKNYLGKQQKNFHLNLGINIFNQDFCQGLGYLLLFDNISTNLSQINKFLYHQINNKSIIFQLYTSLKLKESLQLLNHFKFEFKDNYINSLRQFISSFIIEYNPQKIDIILKAFSAKYFLHQKKVFKSIDSIHMLSFAIIILDIEINQEQITDNTKLFQDFLQCVQGINDGTNFEQKFLNEIIENIRNNPLIKPNNQVQNEFYQLQQNIKMITNQQFTVTKQLSNKKKAIQNKIMCNDQEVFDLYLIDNIMYILQEQTLRQFIVFKKDHLKIDQQQIQLKSNKDKIFKFKYNLRGQIIVSQKQQLVYQKIKKNENI